MIAEPLDLSPQFARLSPLETAISLPFEERARAPGPSHPPSATARGILDEIAEHAVTDGPCYVLFSGGRDSSALLAVTTAAARRTGADEPIPVTAVHADAPETDESSWQQLVLEHLGLRQRVIIDVAGEQSLIGATARSALSRHGLVWPEATAVQGVALSRLTAPATVITGEGGDQVLAARRSTTVKQAVRHPRQALQYAALVARAASPYPLTQALVQRSLRRRTPMPWLRPTAQRTMAAVLAAAEQEPLSWRTATRGALAGSRAALLDTNLSTAIREYRLTPLHPFYDRDFASALGAEGGFWGLGDRTEQMEYLFGDLLPPAVLRRTTKAAFNSTRWGPQEREFATSWEGTGIDPDLIDPDALRTAWLQERPPYGVAFLLQAAWLGSRPARPAPESGHPC